MNIIYHREEGSFLDVEFDFEYEKDNNYGSDIDGNRGVERKEIEDINLYAAFDNAGKDILKDLKVEEVMDIKDKIISKGE